MRFYYLALLLVTELLAFGQEKYKPTIVVLNPYQFNFDSSLLNEIRGYIYRIDYSPEEEKHILDSLSKEEDNIKLMNISEFHYRKQMDFASKFTLSLYGMLTYMVFGQTEKCIVIPTREKSNGSTDKLEIIAKKHKVNWVVNPLSLETYIRDGQKFSRARIQIYDYKRNKVVLDKEYQGDSKNPGFELSCESGSLDCTIHSIIGPSLHDILLTIVKSYQH